MPSQPANKVLDHELYDLSACDCPLEKSTFLHSHLSNCAMWTSHKNFVRVDEAMNMLPPFIHSEQPPVPPFNGTEYDPFGFDATIAKGRADKQAMDAPARIPGALPSDWGPGRDVTHIYEGDTDIATVIEAVTLASQVEVASYSAEADALDSLNLDALRRQLDRNASDLKSLDKGAPTPLDTQVGGDHYKGRGIQPVEYIHANGLGFLEGCVVKRITRWRDKAGQKDRFEDLRKIKHEIDLLIELETKSNCKPAPTMQADTPPGVQHQPV